MRIENTHLSCSRRHGNVDETECSGDKFYPFGYFLLNEPSTFRGEEKRSVNTRLHSEVTHRFYPESHAASSHLVGRMRCNIRLTLSHQASASSSCILQLARVFLARACATRARSKAVLDAAETAGVRGCGPGARLKTTVDGETMLLPIRRGGGRVHLHLNKLQQGTLQGHVHTCTRACPQMWWENVFHEAGELNVG